MKSTKISHAAQNEQFHELTSSELSSVEGGLLFKIIAVFMERALEDAVLGKGASLADLAGYGD
jgi:bacteriocin-like protein